MRLLPLVKRLQVVQRYDDPWFPPTIPNAQTLVYFSALTLQVQQYFGHFAPALRSLALRRPDGTHSQLLCLLGLFPNLDDFKLIRCGAQLEPDSAPISQSAPPLRGRLTLEWFYGEGF